MAGIGVLAVALLAGGAYYAMHQRETRPQPALASGRETAAAPPMANTAPAGGARDSRHDRQGKRIQAKRNQNGQLRSNRTRA